MSDTPKTNQNSIVIAAVLIILLIGGAVYYSNRNSYNHFNMMGIMYSNSPESSKSSSKDSMMGMTEMDHSMMGMRMAETVKDDQTFLENMIPHHQEAIDTSKIVIVKSSDTELKQFAQKVIDDQTKEISSMKSWYKSWFNKDYSLNTTTNMMGDLNKLSGRELDKSYTKGMIMHHQGAVDMAVKIKTITSRNELQQLADNIISSQTREIAILKNWLMVKFNDHSMMGM